MLDTDVDKIWCSLGTKGPKICQQNHVLESLLYYFRQDKSMLSCLLQIMTHLNVTAEIEVHQTWQTLFSLVLCCFVEPVWTVALFFAAAVVTHLLQGFMCLFVFVQRCSFADLSCDQPVKLVWTNVAIFQCSYLLHQQGVSLRALMLAEHFLLFRSIFVNPRNCCLWKSQ